MMEAMIKAAACGVTAAVLGAVLKKTTPELAMLLVLAAGLYILSVAAGGLGTIMDLIEELVQQAGVSEILMEPVLKTVLLSLLTHLTAEICRSAGESGIAAFVETTGAILALAAAIPLVRAVSELMAELLI